MPLAYDASSYTAALRCSDHIDWGLGFWFRVYVWDLAQVPVPIVEKFYLGKLEKQCPVAKKLTARISTPEAPKRKKQKQQEINWVAVREVKSGYHNEYT